MSDDVSLPNPGYRGRRPGQYGRSRSRMDPHTRRLLLFAGGLSAVLVCLVGASSLIGHHSATIPVVAADTRPIRVRPENPGGMQIDAAENDVFSGGVDAGAAKLAPAAEAPNPGGLRDAPRPAASATLAVPPAPPSPLPPAARAVPQAPPPAAVPPPLPVGTATAAKAAVAGLPAAAKAPAHAATVQLAALTTEQAAHQEWQQLAHRMPELLKGHEPVFSRIDRDGHTFWRIRTAGFPDLAQARTFCEQMRTKGGGCSVADF